MAGAMGGGIWVLAFTSFAVGTQAYVFAGLLEALAADLGVSVSAAGQLATAFALTFALAAPPVAMALARHDRKRVIVAGLLVVGLLNLVASFASRLDLLILLRIGCGLAAACVVPIASAAAAQLAPPERRGQALAVVLAGTTIAFILGIPAGSAVGGAFGWRATFSYAGLLAIGAAVAIALVLPAVRPTATRRPPLSAALTPAALRFMSLTLAAFAATFTVVAYVGPVVGLATGADGAGIGLFQMLVGFGSLTGVLIGSRIADRRGRLVIAACLFAGMTLTLAGYSLATVRGPDGFANAWLLGLAMFGNALALFALSPVVQAGLVEAAPEAGPVALALNASAIFFGQGIGAAIGGGTIALGGYGALGLVAAALAAVTALVVLTTFPRRPAATLPVSGGPP